MKFYQYLLFFGIAFSIYFSVNYYIYIHGLQAFTLSPLLKTIYIKLFLLLALAYIAGRVVEYFSVSIFSQVLTWIGSYWLAAMVYFFLIALLIDLIKLMNLFIPILPELIHNNPTRWNYYLGIASIVIVLIIIIAGRYNATHPRIKELTLNIPKKVKGKSELTVALASDIHLGTVMGVRRLNQLISMIDKIQPDLVLFAGDLIDEDPGALIKKDLGKQLRDISAHLGVFAITGNHEYIGGADKAIPYLEEHNIIVLRDSVITLPNGLVLIGREDRDSQRFNGIQRKSIEELITDIDPASPTILLDHQPFNLDKAIENGIDLQLSGHTHHGQLFPFNWITSKFYRISYGYEKVKNTHIYVSCGFGTWGPPIRTNSRPELVKLVLRFHTTT